MLYHVEENYYINFVYILCYATEFTTQIYTIFYSYGAPMMQPQNLIFIKNPYVFA
jgi:hypothetical protein